VKQKAEIWLQLVDLVVSGVALDLKLPQFLQALQILFNLDKVLRNVSQLLQVWKILNDGIEIVPHDFADQMGGHRDLRKPHVPLRKLGEHAADHVIVAVDDHPGGNVQVPQ
jgi:hypothetical protein